VPVLALAAVVLALVLASIALIPFSLVQRYRVGTSRQRARGWLAAINLFALFISIALFLVSAAITNVWVPKAFVYALGGLAAGGALGLVGLALTRWERTPDAIHYTPNRWLVLGITLLVSIRIIYSVWRGWQTWGVAPVDSSWLAVVGVAESLGAGALVLGYYFVYWSGVSRRLRR
jgi:hypothetical protein